MAVERLSKSHWNSPCGVSCEPGGLPSFLNIGPFVENLLSPVAQVAPDYLREHIRERLDAPGLMTRVPSSGNQVSRELNQHSGVFSRSLATIAFEPRQSGGFDFAPYLAARRGSQSRRLSVSGDPPFGESQAGAQSSALACCSRFRSNSSLRTDDWRGSLLGT